MERLTIPDKPIEGGWKRAVIDSRAVKEEAMTIYWRLKKYEDTGLTPEEIMDGQMLTGWIPVEERMPKTGDTVLTYIKHNYAEDNWRAYKVYEYTDHFVGMGNLCNVMAWMPLPEPYKPQVLREAGKGAGQDVGQDAAAPVLRSAT